MDVNDTVFLPAPMKPMASPQKPVNLAEKLSESDESDEEVVEESDDENDGPER